MSEVRKNVSYRVIGIIALLGCCYLISYQVALHQLKDRWIREIEEPMISSETESEKPTEPLHREDKVMEVAADSFTIDSGTEYVLEVYDREQDQLSEYELNPPAYLIGLDRTGLMQYVSDYMIHVPLDEFQKGLLSYEVVSFSEDRVVLRKVYDASTVPYQYYLVVERGYLVVYYADQKTVYEYTGIQARDLPEEEQVKLAYGIFLKDQGELYGVLQGYSS